MKEWMGKETMDNKLGPERAKYLRSKGAFKRRGCPYTGSTEDIHSEWQVDISMERQREQDSKILKIDAVNDTEDSDYALLESSSAFDPPKESEAGQMVKNELDNHESESSKFAAKLDTLIANKDAVLRTFVDYKMEAKQALTKAQKSKDKNANYASVVVQDLLKHCPKLEKCTNILERVCTEDVEDPTEFPKLMEMTENLEEKHKDIMIWAA